MLKAKNSNKIWDIRSIATAILLVLLAGSVVYAGVHIFLAPPDVTASGEMERLKSDYVLMAFQCSMGIVILLLPSAIERKFSLEIPNSMYVVYCIFLFCAIYLGEVRNFYHLIPYWDSILHGFSGGALGALGFLLISILNSNEKIHMHMSPFFVWLFAFCFALSIGALWEIYEFTFDGLLGMNMQKFMLEDGTQLIGRAALSDTMWDLIVDAIGALVSTLVGVATLHKKRAVEE